MKKHIALALVVTALTATVFAQTTNPKYQVTPFGTPPDAQGWVDTISVAADGKGSILAFRRADPPVLIFNREGKFLRGWGNGIFPDKHSIDVDRDGFVWITDRMDQLVYKFTMDGKLLMTLGTKGVAGDNTSQDGKVIETIPGLKSRAHNINIDAGSGDIYLADSNAPGGIKKISKK